PPRVDARAETCYPRQPDQVAVVGVVIRVVVRDEDMAQRRERHSGQGQLPGNAIAAIDHVRDVLADDHLRRGSPRLLWPRSSCSPEEDEPRDRRLSGRGSTSHRARSGDRAQKLTTADDSHMKDPDTIGTRSLASNVEPKSNLRTGELRTDEPLVR